MNADDSFIGDFRTFCAALEQLRALDAPEPDDFYQRVLQTAKTAYSQLQTTLDEFAEELGKQQLRLDSGVRRVEYRQKGPGFARERFQRRLASFRLFAQRQQWEIVAHDIERNGTRLFTIISDDSVILIELTPHGGVSFCGEGPALQALSAWALQENPRAVNFSGYPSNYPMVKQFQRVSLPYKRKQSPDVPPLAEHADPLDD